jgi:hypothetical protein
MVQLEIYVSNAYELLMTLLRLDGSFAIIPRVLPPVLARTPTGF